MSWLASAVAIILYADCADAVETPVPVGQLPARFALLKPGVHRYVATQGRSGRRKREGTLQTKNRPPAREDSLYATRKTTVYSHQNY